MAGREKKITGKTGDYESNALHRLTEEPAVQEHETAAIASEKLETIKGLSFHDHLRLLSEAGSPQQVRSLALNLQRSYGNAYVQSLFSSHTLRATMAVFPARLPEGQMAALLAQDSLPQIKPPQLQRPGQAEEEEEEVQGSAEAKKASDSVADLETRIKKALGGGRPLPQSWQARLAPRFGRSITEVRIHTDNEAHRLTRALKAASFTSGRDIFFRKGAYNLESGPGRNLMLRELRHVIEQEGRSALNQNNRSSGTPGRIPLSVTPLTMFKPGRSERSPFWQSIPRNFKPVSRETLQKAYPRMFINGGKTGAAAVWWGGGAGGGGQGNQYVGDVTEVRPVIHTAPSGTMNSGGQPMAWVEDGTGTATVTRSYVGVLVGANGTYYITERAVAQIDRHEEDHVNASERHHDSFIAPLEQRVLEHTGPERALQSGSNSGEARAALETYINWNAAIDEFKQNDNDDNYPPTGRIDQADLADPNTKIDYGPREVEGVHYDHYVDTPPGPPAEETETAGEAVVEWEESAGMSVEEGESFWGEEETEEGEEGTDWEELMEEAGEDLVCEESQKPDGQM